MRTRSKHRRVRHRFAPSAATKAELDGYLREWRGKRRGSHWLATKISEVYLRIYRARDAIRWARRALDIMPTCPLAIWNLACALEWNGDRVDAINAWDKIFDMGLRGLQSNPCTEGRTWSRSLLADTCYRLARANEAINDHQASIKYYTIFLRLARSDYQGHHSREVASIRRVIAQLEVRAWLMEIPKAKRTEKFGRALRTTGPIRLPRGLGAR